MTSPISTVTYPVHDLAAAKRLYGRLFAVPAYMDEPYYVAFTVGGQDVGLDPNGHQQGMTGPVGYWHVADIKKSLDELVEAGARVQREVRDVGAGKLVATVVDADGNVTGLIQSA